MFKKYCIFDYQFTLQIKKGAAIITAPNNSINEKATKKNNDIHKKDR